MMTTMAMPNASVAAELHAVFADATTVLNISASDLTPRQKHQLAKRQHRSASRVHTSKSHSSASVKVVSGSTKHSGLLTSLFEKAGDYLFHSRIPAKASARAKRQRSKSTPSQLDSCLANTSHWQLSPAEDLILHKDSNLTRIWDDMQFLAYLSRISNLPTRTRVLEKIRATRISRFQGYLREHRVSLPTAKQAVHLIERLRNGTCAVVGASRALGECPNVDDICEHDVVIRVNDHEPFGRCTRTDVQFVNQHACVALPEPKNGSALRNFSDAVQSLWTRRGVSQTPCTIKPSLFRIRSEWNPSDARRFSVGALLSSGLASAHANAAVCARSLRKEQVHSATSGGVAIAFAMHACASVSLFGLGGGRGYAFDASRLPPEGRHNILAERRWIDEIARAKLVKPVCISQKVLPK